MSSGVKCMGVDQGGRVRLSRKAAMGERELGGGASVVCVLCMSDYGVKFSEDNRRAALFCMIADGRHYKCNV